MSKREKALAHAVRYAIQDVQELSGASLPSDTLRLLQKALKMKRGA